jgi:hypothetical protein
LVRIFQSVAMTWMEHGDIMMSKLSQTQNKYYQTSFIGGILMWILKKVRVEQ